MTLGELLTLLSYLVGAGMFVWAARRRKLATEGMAILAAVGFAAGIVGAKVTQTIASGLPLATVANPGGRALLGGLLFGWLGVEVAKRAMGIRRSTGDLFALALPAGEAVGRVGCHFNGCCYGIPWDEPGAVWQHGAARFPSQLASALVAAATFGFLLWLSKDGSPWKEEPPREESLKEENVRGAAEGVQSRTPKPNSRSKASPLGEVRVGVEAGVALRVERLREGDLFRIYLLLFGLTRFGLEFVRWRESTVYGLSPMQWFCLDLIVIASIGLLRRKANDVPQLRPGV